MKDWIRLWMAIMLVGVPLGARAQPSLGDILDGMPTLKYEKNTRFALGDTLSVLNPLVPRQRCVDYERGDVKHDTEGAVFSKLNLYMVRSFEELEQQLKVSFWMKGSAKAAFGQFGGDASTEVDTKIDDFLKKEAESLMIILEAASEHGREYISNFKVKSEYKALLEAGNRPEFEKLCGTHFIRAITKRSGVRIVFNVTNLSSSAKRLVSARFDSSGSVKGGYAGITAEVRSQMTADISSTLALATRFGKVSVAHEAIGSLGIASLGQAIRFADISSSDGIGKIFDAMANLTKDFTLANSAPDVLIPIPFVADPASTTKFDPNKYEVMAEIYKALLRVEGQLAIYEKYKQDNYQIWSKYFRIATDRFADLRSKLLKSFTTCRENGECAADYPRRLEGVLLEDVVFDGTMRADCPLGLIRNARMNPAYMRPVQVLSSIVIAYSGSIRYMDELDVYGIELARILPNLTEQRLPFSADSQFRANDEKTRLFVTVHRQSIDPEKAFANDDVNIAYIDEMRKEAAQSIYLVRFRTTRGLVIENVLGYPDMSGCKIIQEP